MKIPCHAHSRSTKIPPRYAAAFALDHRYSGASLSVRRRRHRRPALVVMPAPLHPMPMKRGTVPHSALAGLKASPAHESAPRR